MGFPSAKAIGRAYDDRRVSRFLSRQPQRGARRLGNGQGQWDAADDHADHEPSQIIESVIVLDPQQLQRKKYGIVVSHAA
jgi:hypothetical protein